VWGVYVGRPGTAAAAWSASGGLKAAQDGLQAGAAAAVSAAAACSGRSSGSSSSLSQRWQRGSQFVNALC
jgi:hypothetical protein